MGFEIARSPARHLDGGDLVLGGLIVLFPRPGLKWMRQARLSD